MMLNGVPDLPRITVLNRQFEKCRPKPRPSGGVCQLVLSNMA